MTKNKIIVIGAGPSGVMAAGIASQRGHDVILLEKNDKILKKLFITGKGRCNITNNCSINELVAATVRGGKFLLSAFNAFSAYDTMAFFESRGLALKTERGRRVFPLSDKSSDVIKVMQKFLLESRVDVRLNTAVSTVTKKGDLFEVDGITADKVIVATGGLSYRATGSTGDGYKVAKSFGHTIVDIVAALTPIRVKQDIASLEGLSLKNVRVSIKQKGCQADLTPQKKVFLSEFGEMLFGHNTLTGPIVLSLSSFINRLDLADLQVVIDLKPALDMHALDKRVLSDFEGYKNKDFINCLDQLLPKSLIPYIIKQSHISPRTKVNDITRSQREKLVHLIKNLTFDIAGLGPIDGAIITSGGVSLAEVNPKNMQSKLVEGLHFVGEMLDVDALTGGYNIQIALSTGYIAACRLNEK